MANFDFIKWGTKTYLGPSSDSKCAVQCGIRIYGSNNTSTRKATYKVALVAKSYYATAWNWGSAGGKTQFKVNGKYLHNGTGISEGYAFTQNGTQNGTAYKTLQTSGDYTASYNDNGKASTVKVYALLEAKSIYRNYDGKYYDLSTKFSETAIALPDISSAVSKPSVPSNQKVNGVTTYTALQKSDNLTLTWSKASGGTYGVSGYKIYWSKSDGWQLLDTVDANTTSYTTSLSQFYNTIRRGGTVGFQITTYNSHYESAKKSGAYDNNKVIFDTLYFDMNISKSNTTTNSTRVTWTSNIPISYIEASVGDENSYYIVQRNINSTSGAFTISGLPVGTTQPLFVYGHSTDGYKARDIGLIFLKKIAVFTYVPSSWRIEDPLTVTIDNPGNCSMNLYLSYNGVEIIGRSNITLDSDGDYTLTLSSSEKETLYSLTGSNPNPTFTLILKSYQNSVKVGEDSRTIGGTLDTHAWVKVGSTWRKAKVWVKPGSTWRVATPWVKVGSGWRRS